jgi:hypothetical protein
MTPKEGSVLVIISIIALYGAYQMSQGKQVVSSGGKRQNHRGHGDTQDKEGFGFDVHLSAGIDPDDETRWHYGGGMPGERLPTNWSRHRLSYPRRQSENMEELMVTPMSHPAFPKRDCASYYNPPADSGLGGDYA